MTETVYRGRPGGDVQVIVSDDPTQVTRTFPLPHFVKHSPDGYSWGYGGSGPAELARCLLIHALGERALCTTCNGRGRVTATDEDDPGKWFRPALEGDDPAAVVGCIDCDAGFAPAVERCYQTFKFEHVAGWPQEETWEITREEILAWHAAQSSTRH
jgi:hypothetical protein